MTNNQEGSILSPTLGFLIHNDGFGEEHYLLCRATQTHLFYMKHTHYTHNQSLYDSRMFFLHISVLSPREKKMILGSHLNPPPSNLTERWMFQMCHRYPVLHTPCAWCRIGAVPRPAREAFRDVAICLVPRNLVITLTTGNRSLTKFFHAYAVEIICFPTCVNL